MKKRWKQLCAVILAAVLILSLAACSQETSGTSSSGEQGKPLTLEVHGNLDDSFRAFLDGLVEKFPNVSLKYEFQWDDFGYNEIARRILHGDGPDFFVVDGSYLSSMTEQGLLLNLTNEPFSTRYHISTMTRLNDQGQIYGLPLPADTQCLVYNEAILQEHGITEPPQSVPELLDVCKKLGEEGQCGILVDDTLYRMLMNTFYVCKPEGYEWLQSYNQAETTMEGTPAADCWKTMEQFAQYGGCASADVQATSARKTDLLMNGKYAFRVTTISNIEYMLQQDPSLPLKTLPLLGETADDQWVYSIYEAALRYWAASKEMDKPENAAKKKAILEIFDWISSEEGQRLLASSNGSSLSYVNDVPLEGNATMQGLMPTIEKGHFTNANRLERGVNNTVLECSVNMLDGAMTAQEAVAACDKQNREYIPPGEVPGRDEVIGKAADHIYWRKPTAVTVGSPMTQLGAMAMADAFPEADFAFAMAKNTGTSLYPGDITLGDALDAGTGEQDMELVLVEATGKQIREVIDAGVGSPTEPTLIVPYGIAGAGRLLHPTGLTYKADINREKGDKITQIVLDDGSAFDLQKTYTIVVSGLMVDVVTEPNLKDCKVTPTGKYLSDVLVSYIRKQGTVSSPKVGFEIAGAKPIYEFP